MTVPRSAGSTNAETYDSPGLVPLDGRGGWWAEWREDLARYRAHYAGSLIKPLLLEQALWALLQYRVASSVYRSRLPWLLKRPLLLVCIASHKIAEATTGISLPHTADLGPGLYIGHYGVTLVHQEAVIGAGCNIAQGVNIGLSGRGERRGVPRIGRRVYVAANSTVAGMITVGDDAVISANSLVVRDVPPGSTAVGVPATVIDNRGTPGMGLHQRPR